MTFNFIKFASIIQKKYAMKSVQFVGISPEELQDAIRSGVRLEIEKLKTEFRPKEPPEYLTRKDVKDMFQIDMSTVHNWTKAGKLRAYQIGSRVYYRRDEVEQALQPLRV
jgi:hypothetical protein